MKKIFALVLVLSLPFVLIGCVNKEQTPNTDPAGIEQRPAASTEPSQSKAVSYESVVSWVNYSNHASLYASALNSRKMTISSVRHLPIFKCESADELEAFRSGFSEVLDFSARYDEVESFDETAQKYDPAFFEENMLLLVYLTAGSGSCRYGVDSVAADADGVVVHIKQVNEIEDGTCDMAGWLIGVSVSKDAVETCTLFDADLR